MTLALYPGSFDPVTFGHVNLIRRSAKIFDRVVVAVARNARKQALFSVDERMQMIRASVPDLPQVEVSTFDGLLADYAQVLSATAILRGLRAVRDFEYEFQLAHMNRRLGSGLETIFMMTGEEHFYVSSQLVREVAALGGKVHGLVPPHVEARLKEIFKR